MEVNISKLAEKLSKTPAYIVSEPLLERNLKILERVQKESGAKILVALKGYATWATFPLLKKYLAGAAASGLWEARLGKMVDWEVHTYCPAFRESEIDEVAELSHTIIFNSFSQLERFRHRVKGKAEIGLRVNPGVSSSPVPLYDPCAPYSRLGIPRSQFQPENLEGVTGLHFHALCEQLDTALERVLEGFKANFGEVIAQMEWVNFGGGHHITRPGYNVDNLIRLIKEFYREFPNLKKIYLEPGEAVGLNAGFLVAEVLDIVHNGMDIAILDTSAEAHMPDVLAMPYRPRVVGAGEPGEKKYTYRLGGVTCLAGDVIGDYSFDRPLKVGDRIIFEDMAIYTMVKNTAFNGVRLPDIVIHRQSGELYLSRRFHFEDFRERLS
ncbi:MAG: carboxynorspermidine decarboxylase [Epsilonproteobacteria bacterium]|nr:carboxynorspermidine decarboxylase [Campylobacterota bacterium]NPA89298.1 carboxynorspermidine decarboxylase [Campylobacterota bacterium]